jgi:hypothetical protein
VTQKCFFFRALPGMRGFNERNTSGFGGRNGNNSFGINGKPRSAGISTDPALGIQPKTMNTKHYFIRK